MVFLIAAVMMFTMMENPSAFAADLPTGGNLDETPQNLTVELKEREAGRPYFMLKWTNPQSVKELVQYWDDLGEAPFEYQVDMKVGDGKWRYDAGESISGNSLHGGYDETGDFTVDDATYDPIDAGEFDTIDIKANIYHFRVRYAFLVSNDEEEYWIYSPFSNVASVGTKAFYKEVSDWAKSELQKANDLGLIPDILKGTDMTKPITREEFAKLAVVL